MANFVSVIDKLPIAVVITSNGRAINEIVTAVIFSNDLIKNIVICLVFRLI